MVKTFETSDRNIEYWLKKEGVELKLKKCTFGAKTELFLGDDLTPEDVKKDLEKAAAI